MDGCEWVDVDGGGQEGKKRRQEDENEEWRSDACNSGRMGEGGVEDPRQQEQGEPEPGMR